MEICREYWLVRRPIVVVEVLFFFLYWLPVNLLFFLSRLHTFVGGMILLRRFHHWIVNTHSRSLARFLPQTRPCNRNEVSPIYANLLPVSNIALDRMRLKSNWKIALFRAKTTHKQHWFPWLPITNWIKLSNWCKIIDKLAKKCSFYESKMAKDVLKQNQNKKFSILSLSSHLKGSLHRKFIRL